MKKCRVSALLLTAALLLGGCSEKEAPPTLEDVLPAEIPTTEAPAPTPTTVRGMLNHMSLEEKIHQLFIITPEVLTGYSQVTQFGNASREALKQHPVCGLIYFSPNLEDTEQTSQMLADTQAYAMELSGLGMFLAIDEEGGTVARVADTLGTTAIEPMQNYGERNDVGEAFEAGMTIGNDIGALGFNLDFAPVADVNLNEGNELGDRIFSDDPAVVAEMVDAVVTGLQSTGVAATLKHFPGLGAEDGNAHTDDKIIIDRTLDQLRETEFVPFTSGIAAGADFVMVSHQTVTGVGDGLPACLSPTVCTELLREELGFDGIIITDSFQMNTITGTYSSSEAVVMALEAGVDIILMPENFADAIQGVLDAVEDGTLTEERINESVERILNEKKKLGLMG